MTTENQQPATPISSTVTNTTTNKLISKLEETRGNSHKPLSLRPGRSVKKNLSLKPLGSKSR